MSMTQSDVRPMRTGVPALPSKLGYDAAMGYAAERGKVLSAQCSVTPSLDADRKVLARLAQQGHRNEHEMLLNTDAVKLLFLLASANDWRMKRHTLLSTVTPSSRVNTEAITALEVRGWIEHHGQFVELTEAGNDMARALVVFAQGKGAGV